MAMLAPRDSKTVDISEWNEEQKETISEYTNMSQCSIAETKIYKGSSRSKTQKDSLFGDFR